MEILYVTIILQFILNSSTFKIGFYLEIDVASAPDENCNTIRELVEDGNVQRSSLSTRDERI